MSQRSVNSKQMTEERFGKVQKIEETEADATHVPLSVLRRLAVALSMSLSAQPS